MNIEPAGSPPKPATVVDLFKSRNPIVHSVLSMWKMGYFPSFEAALIQLAVVLVENSDYLTAELVKMYQNNPSPIAIEKKS